MQRNHYSLTHLDVAHEGSNPSRRGREGRSTQPTVRFAPARLLPAGLGALSATALVLLALWTASAAAAPTWLSPLNLSEAGQNAGQPEVAVDSAGDAVAVWYRSDGSNTIIQSAERPAGGAWSEPVNLSEEGQNAEKPQVAVDPQGNAVAVWRRNDGSKYRIQAATRPPGGAWSEAVDLSEAGENASEPRVAIDSQGNAVAVWQRPVGPSTVVQSAERPAGGAWSAAVTISPSEKGASVPYVAVDPQGNAVAVWRYFDGTNLIIQSAERPAGGAWSAAVRISAEGQNAESPQVAVDPQGDAVAVWFREGGTEKIIQSAERPAGGAWSEPVNLSAEEQIAVEAQVAVDSQGDAVALWRRREGSNDIIESAERPAGGAWSGPVELSAKGQDAESPRVAVDPGGDAVAVWHIYASGDEFIQGAARPAGGAWSEPVELSEKESTEEIGVAVDPEGNAVAVWERDDGSNYRVQAAGYDAAGPQLRSLSIPASGTAGVPLSFSVSPFDVWSTLGATSWSFGDGDVGAAAASHTYAAPGTYQVTLTAADALGNSTSATGTVAIAPAPATDTTPPTPTPSGRAIAAGVAHRKGSKVLLRVRCRGGGPCRGTVKLSFERKLIAMQGFSLAANRAKTLRIKLNRRGRMLVQAANRHRLKLKLVGRNVKPRVVVLKGP